MRVMRQVYHRQPRSKAIRAGIYAFALALAATFCLPASALATDEDSLATTMPGSYRITSDNGLIRFPFDVFRGDIRFRAQVNSHDVHLLLDDGFMWDPLLFWGSPQVDSLGLSYDGEISIGGEDDDDAIASRTASGITVGLPGVEFTDQTAVVTPYSSGTSDMWWGSVGQISATFFKHFVVDINFDEMMITLIEPGNFEYSGDGVAIPWKPMGFGPWSIPATLQTADGRSVSFDLMMDLGYNDQLEISTTGEHAIPTPAPAVPASLGMNIQGQETRGHIGRIARVEIGGYEINDVVASFIAPEFSDNTWHEVMIGLGLLSRFNLVFDYSRQRLYIEPNHTFGDSFEYNMSGMTLTRGQGDYWDVTHVVPGSPAADADLRTGDRVSRINDQPPSQLDFWTLRPMLRQEGKTLTLIVEHEGQRRDVSITLRRVI